MRLKTFLVTVALLISMPVSAEEYVEVSAREGVSQPFLWMPHKDPLATVILFAGGKGKIQLDQSGEIGRRGNFLVRSRELFRQQGLNVAVIDAPSDHDDEDGMFYGFRTSQAHAEDVHAVIHDVNQRSAVPTWLVGTSRGTESVANAGVRLAGDYDGLVFTASVTVDTNKGSSILENDLSRVTTPVFIASHMDDGCFVTPPVDSEAIQGALKGSSKVEVKLYEGGKEAISSACKAKSEHGFYGIEELVVQDIAAFIKASSKK